MLNNLSEMVVRQLERKWALEAEKDRAADMLRSLACYSQAYMFVDASGPCWRILHMNDSAAAHFGGLLVTWRVACADGWQQRRCVSDARQWMHGVYCLGPGFFCDSENACDGMDSCPRQGWHGLKGGSVTCTGLAWERQPIEFWHLLSVPGGLTSRNAVAEQAAGKQCFTVDGVRCREDVGTYSLTFK